MSGTIPSAAAIADGQATARRRARPVPLRLLGLLAAIVLLAIAIVASLAIGARSIPLETVIAALGGDRSGDGALVVLESRLPRTAIGVAAGLALGVAGALIQAVTRNPLADPGLLGVTAGSSFLLALGVGVLGVGSATGYLWFALLGALLATVAVYLIGATSRGGVSPARLTLAGVALGAVLSGITSALVLVDPRVFSSITAWRAGALRDRDWDVLLSVLPFLVIGLLIALALGPALNAVALGDDLAASLGANVAMARVAAVVAVTLLAGGATAVAGPISFIGLMVPHVARWIAGPDQRWILVLTALLSPVLLLAADVAARIALPTGELPVGFVTAAIGAPVLIYLVRRTKVSGL